MVTLGHLGGDQLPIIQMSKVRPRDIGWPAQSHTACYSICALSQGLLPASPWLLPWSYPGSMTRFPFKCLGGIYNLLWGPLIGKGGGPALWRLEDTQECRPIHPQKFAALRLWAVSDQGSSGISCSQPVTRDGPSLSTVGFSSTAHFLTCQPWGHFTFSRASTGCPSCE